MIGPGECKTHGEEERKPFEGGGELTEEEGRRRLQIRWRWWRSSGRWWTRGNGEQWWNSRLAREGKGGGGGEKGATTRWPFYSGTAGSRGVGQEVRAATRGSRGRGACPQPAGGPSASNGPAAVGSGELH
jgi:hypothetical protein